MGVFKASYLLLAFLLLAAPLATLSNAESVVEDAADGADEDSMDDSAEESMDDADADAINEEDNSKDNDEDDEDDDLDGSKRFLKNQVCYGDLGCFSNTGNFFSYTKRPVMVLPQSPEEINTKFLLFTRLNKANPHALFYNNADSVLRSKFSKRRPTKLVIHGFLGEGVMSWMNRIREAMLKRVDCNMIQVGWSGGAVTMYSQATSNTRVVGAVVARMITWLESRFGVKRSDVHIIGFSLGAQISGYAGAHLRASGHQVARITGLDPAGPYFEGTAPEVRLDPTDAQFVDVIHTDASVWVAGLPVLAGGFGTKAPLGHLDFYSNGGQHQPGCSSLTACDHSRAPQLYISTINQPKAAFSAFPCNSYDRFLKGLCGSTCPSGGCVAAGFYADRNYKAGSTARINYFLTGPVAPFALVHYHVSFFLDRTSTAGNYGELQVQLNVEGGGKCGATKLAGDSRKLEPSSFQKGVFGCSWPALSHRPELSVTWGDASTLGSVITYRIHVAAARLTEMVSGRVDKYCGFGEPMKSDEWRKGGAC